MPIPSGYTSGQVVQAVPTGIQSALVFITGATFTSVTSVSLPANTFSATYTNYLVQFYCTTAAVESTISGRFRASGSDNTTSNYSFAGNGVYSNTNDANVAGNDASSFSNMRLVHTSLPYSATLTISEPQTANRATVAGMITANGNTTTAKATSLAFSGLFNGTTSFDSFTFLSAENITGSYKVYGYSNS